MLKTYMKKFQMLVMTLFEKVSDDAKDILEEAYNDPNYKFENVLVDVLDTLEKVSDDGDDLPLTASK